MSRHARHAWLGTAAAVLALGLPSARPAVADEPSSEIPAAFAPFEHLIGAWKGAGIPTANRIEGWPEKHAWAWVFSKGQPVGLSVTMTGDKTLAKAELTFDKVSGDYRLSGTDPKGEPVVFTGKLADDRQTLPLTRQGQLTGGTQQRLTLRLNSNKIRYVLWDDRQEVGAPRFSRFIEVNQGKEGESFAAGGAASNLPKCILTGGAATMSVTFKGKSYPVCCTGCRDEFEADPEKYVKKAALRAAAAKDQPKNSPGISRIGKDDGSFDALLIDESPSSKPKSKGKPSPTDQEKAREKSETKDQPTDEAKPTPSDSKDSGDAPVNKAAELLQKAQGLETDGKARAAVIFYRIIVQDHPKTPQAKTAAQRLRALGQK